MSFDFFGFFCIFYDFLKIETHFCKKIRKSVVGFERPQKNFVSRFVNFPTWEKCHRLLENSRNAKKILWLFETDKGFSNFFYKSVFFLNRKKYKKNQMTSKTGCPPYNLLGNLFFGGLVFCWYFKYILPKLLFWELSAGQGRGERMGLPWKI